MTWKTLSRDEKTTAIQPFNAAGLSAREIGEKLGTSRDAILGHAHRYMGGLLAPGRAKKVVVFGSKRVPTRKVLVADLAMVEGITPEPVPEVEMPPPKPKRVVLPAPIEIETPPIRFMDRKMGRECAYILDMASLTCCGNKVKFGYEWCGKHAAIVWGGAR